MTEEVSIDTRNPRLLKIAQILSLVSTPPLIAVVCIGVLAYFYGHSTDKFFLWWFYGSALIVGPSAVWLVAQSLKRQEFDIDVSDRADRMVPLLFASLGAFVVTHLVGERFPGSTLSIGAQLVALVLISLTVITFFWKVSLHTTSVSALITFLVVSVSWYYAILYLLLVVIGWSRFYQRKHTRNQLIFGSILGISLTFLVKYFFYQI